jgi:hypothetical protein
MQNKSHIMHWYMLVLLFIFPFPLIPEYKINHGLGIVVYTVDCPLCGEFMTMICSSPKRMYVLSL